MATGLNGICQSGDSVFGIGHASIGTVLKLKQYFGKFQIKEASKKY